MKNKLVSIIINCFNGEKFLSKTLQSVLDQTYKNFEVIFVDNCSTDKSKAIFKKTICLRTIVEDCDLPWHLKKIFSTI